MAAHPSAIQARAGDMAFLDFLSPETRNPVGFASHRASTYLDGAIVAPGRRQALLADKR
jgi:hypothetical protein